MAMLNNQRVTLQNIPAFPYGESPKKVRQIYHHIFQIYGDINPVQIPIVPSL